MAKPFLRPFLELWDIWVTLLCGRCKSRRGQLHKHDLPKLIEKIMATQAEIVAQLNATSAKLDKIGAETQSLLTKIQELLAIIANIPDASPELVAAAAALQVKADTVDALVDDLPVTPTP